MRSPSNAFVLLSAVCLWLSLAGKGAAAPFPSPSPGGTIELRVYGIIPTPSPTPKPTAAPLEEPSKPIPRGWIVGGAIAGALLAAGLFYGAARAWRESNLFDRQYRFPAVSGVAVRLGAEKCGGHLATVRFGPERPRAAASETKNV